MELKNNKETKLQIYEREMKAYQYMLRNAPVSLQTNFRFVINEYKKLIEYERNKHKEISREKRL